MTIDIKRELLEKARHMQRPAKVFSFSENGEGNSHYDPMYLLREGDSNDLVQNAREIAQSHYPYTSRRTGKILVRIGTEYSYGNTPIHI